MYALSYWYFKDIGFKCEPYLCNGCHYLMQKAMSFNDFAIICVKGKAYRIHFFYMRKDDAISIIVIWSIKKKPFITFFLHIKISETTYYQRNRDVILNIAKDYHENDKERLREQARYKYRNLSGEVQNKKREYRRNWYQNMSGEKKQRLKESQKKYRETRRCQYNNRLNSFGSVYCQR